MDKAAEQCIQQRQTVVMLVPEDMSVGWFSKALESVDEVRIITDGRINFIEPSTGLEKKGNSKGSMLLIWRPFISPRRMFTTVSKAALMAIGQEAVDEIESNHNRHRWTVEECRAIKAEYQQKLKDLRNSRSEAA